MTAGMILESCKKKMLIHLNNSASFLLCVEMYYLVYLFITHNLVIKSIYLPHSESVAEVSFFLRYLKESLKSKH